MQLTGYDQTLYTFTPVSGLIDGGWQLIEIAALNVGTNNGQRRAWLDGHPAATTTAKWNGRTLDHFVLGGTWENDSRWTGTVAFDDVRVTDTPPPSTLVVQLPDAGVVGDCLPAVVGLVSSDGAGQPAPYLVDVSFSLLGLDGPYSDSACTANFATGLAAGSSMLSVYFRAVLPGTASATPENIDFIAASWTLAITGDAGFDAGAPDAGLADAGAPDGGPTDAGQGDGGSADGGEVDAGAADAGGTSVPFNEHVACGCSAAQGALAWLALMSVLRRSRRRVSRDSR
jgi:hypothetical protein